MSTKSALIIGNTSYTDPALAGLTAPGKDAADFARILQDADVCAFDEVKVLLDQPSSAAIEAIDEFFDQRKPDDLLVLYFSGHGVRDELGSLYLAFTNTIRSRLRSTAVKSDYIREAMDQSRSRRQVLILDCCNSGAFPQGVKAEVGGAMGMMAAFQGYGRYVLTASDATQFAWEGDQVIGATDNSLFTHFLIQGLRGEADTDGDGKITVDKLYDYAFQEIARVTPKQTPTKSATKQEGEIVLRQITRVEDIKPVSLPDDLVEAAKDSRTFVREGAVQQLGNLLGGRNLGLARSAREALEKIAGEDDSIRVRQAASALLKPIHEAEQKEAEARRAAQQAEQERLERERLEAGRLAAQKAEAERKAHDEMQRLAVQRAEQERLERERLEAQRLAAAEAASASQAREEVIPPALVQPVALHAAEPIRAAYQQAAPEAVQGPVPRETGTESWFRLWMRVLTRPNAGNYSEIASAPDKGLGKAYLWMIVGALVFFAAYNLAGFVAPRSQAWLSSLSGSNLSPAPSPGSLLVNEIIWTPLAAIFLVLFFSVIVGLTSWIARLFHGKGGFRHLAYFLAVVFTPVFLVGALLSLASMIPYVGLCFSVVTLLLGVYAIVLAVQAVRAVNQFGLGPAIASTLVPPIGIFLIGCCGLSLLLGGLLRNVPVVISTPTLVPTP